jgi:glutamine synthetase
MKNHSRSKWFWKAQQLVIGYRWVNLLSPSKTPMSNLQFLTFFINTIKAVNDYEALLRGAIATASNDHRLANEAPPAIISVFIESN